MNRREEIAARYQRIVDDYMAEVEESVREFEQTLKEATRQLEEVKKTQQGEGADKGTPPGTATNNPAQPGKNYPASSNGARGVRGRIFE